MLHLHHKRPHKLNLRRESRDATPDQKDTLDEMSLIVQIGQQAQ